MCFVIADFSKHLIGIFNNRRTFSFMNRRNLFHHICNLIGIGNYNFFGFFASQIGKFLKHFFGGMQIKRWLHICIIKSLSCHDNSAVDFILRV